MTTHAWHVHHYILVEPLTEPIEVRQAYIGECKPKGEIALRLRLLRPVRGKLPAAYVRAAAAMSRAEAAYIHAEAGAVDRTYAAYLRARAIRAWAASLPAIMALHAIECPDCPWDGETIFSKAKR